MPYVHFWHQYAHHAASSPGPGVDLGAVLGIIVCLLLVTAWAAYQAQARCPHCSSWPVQCRCGRRGARSR